MASSEDSLLGAGKEKSLISSEFQDSLKSFVKRGTTSSRKERRQVLRDLNQFWSDEATGISEGPLQAILFNVGVCLPRYIGDAISCQELLKFVQQLLDKSAPDNYGLFLSMLSSLADTLGLEKPPKYSKKLARLLLRISVFLGGKLQLGSAEWKSLVDLQSRLLYVSLNAVRHAEENMVYKIMHSIFATNPESNIAKLVNYLAPDEATYVSAGFFTFIALFALRKGNGPLLDHFKKSPEIVSMAAHFVRLTFSSKQPAPTGFLSLSEMGFIRLIDQTSFKEHLLPPMVKSLLRNPEVILPAVIAVLNGVAIDLSPFCMDIGKQLATQLHSKVEASRKLSAEASKSLAEQCIDSTAVDELVSYFFAVLNGSEGKITLAVERIDVLSGIGNLSCQPRGDLQNSADKVATLFIAAITGEAHESVAVHAISMLGLWCLKFSKVPSSLLGVFKNLAALKSSVIRTAYLMCMSNIFKDQTSSIPSEVIPVLAKIVDSASSKSGDTVLATEALPAACILLLDAASKAPPFWNAITDTVKQLFASEKFITTCSGDVLKFLLLLVERIFVFHYDRLKPEAVRMFIRTLSYALLRSRQSERQLGLKAWRRIITSQRIGKLSEELVIALKGALVKLKSLEGDKPTETDGHRPWNYSKSVIVILTEIADAYVELDFSAADKGRLIVECLLISSEQGIALLRPSMWISLLRRFRHDSLFPDKLVEDHIDEMWERILTEESLSDDALRNAVKTFSGFPTPVTVAKTLASIKKDLYLPEVLVVSLPDVLIFESPAGELYDKSVLETNSENDSKGNIKRESKAYSYKDQLAEIELRKELDEKRKAKFGGKAPPLTAKQKEIVTKQMQKEDVVRQSVQKVYRKIQRPFLILDSMIEGNPECMRYYLSEIIAIVSPLLHVPLTATAACSTWILMSGCVHEDLTHGGLAKSLAMVTLRVLEPACTLSKSWTQENLLKSVERVIHGVLASLETPSRENGIDRRISLSERQNSLSELEIDSTVAVSDVCFALPLIRVVVNEVQAKKLGLSEVVPVEAFAIVCKALELCADGGSNDAISGLDLESTIIEMDENNPAFLPLHSILEMLIDVSQGGKGRFESDGCQAIGNFAKAVTRIANDDATLESQIIGQLLNLLFSPKIPLRIASIQAISTLSVQCERFLLDAKQRLFFERRLFVAAYDADDTKVAEFAMDLFRDLNLKPSQELAREVIDDVTCLKEFLRNSAAAALGAMLPHFPDLTSEVLQSLIQKYNKNVEDTKPKVDKFGRPTTEQQIDSWPARCGIAMALMRITPSLGQETSLKTTMDFLLQNPCALRDEKAAVRLDMLHVAVALIDHHGKAHVATLLAKLEEFLTNAPKTADYDVVRQSAIVIMGNLAKHLDAKHPKIRPVVHQLLAALSTPSEEVQKAVSSCIAPLVVNIEDDIKSVVPNLLHVLYESDSYAHRRGAAYGLAGVFVGLGIMSLKDYDIMVTIMGGLQDKKNAQRRESSLLAISMLSLGLGKVFEPFVVQAIPFVLQSIGDGNIHVRQAAEEASKASMSQLSGPGVKLVLPALLKGLHEDAWRAKSAAIDMLGDMAFCAPRQLSSSLPIVVPNLIETLGDSHTKVQEAAVSSLKKIASVIKNPEVVNLVPNILSALQDPAMKTASCLKTILQTQFIHVIDAASLALLMPVIRRAIYDRGTENRKLSAQIMASLYSLADQKDLLPYLEGILPGLKNCLLDPAPEVRLCAAKAIAALIRGTGENGFEQLKDWLFAKLVSDSNSVDRSGAAQGLAESLGVLGVAKLRSMMPEFLSIIMNEKTVSHVRDGYLLVFVYLPAVFGQDFTAFISDIIPALLTGLADDAEYVRETALQCGQRIVTFFADSAIELLLPQLEVGMFDENWRIRSASVQLLGDLLYKISGASGKHTTAGLDEDENFGTDQSHAAILHRLGESHRNRVLAGLYISRSDNALVVRQAALHVWKVIVTNTPKTLREILPELFEILLDALASENEERRQTAAKTLGELVRKLGERILPEIIPILQDGLNSKEDEHREGVCVGLMEIISSSNKETVIMYCDILEPTLTKALMDTYPGVRRAAAEAFCMLDSVVGHKILDDILPVLFDKVTDPVEGDNALDGLQQIMARRSRIVLPYLIPRLTTPPVNTKTLALLTAVAGEALSKHLGKILPSLLASLQSKIGTPDEETEIGFCRSVMLSVEDEAGVATLVDTLMTGVQTEKNRMAAITLLDLFYANTKVDVRSFFGTTIRQLIRMYILDDPALIKKVSSVIGTLIKKTPTDVVYENVVSLRTAIRAVHMELKVPCVPGFCLPDGVAVFIPMLRDALLAVAADEKEVVGQTIADLVRLSNQAGLRSSVVTITGPIIRILGDRYAPNIRAVMLDALNCLIEKCTILIKPFVPQIQTTVSRALSDPTRSVRVKAGNVAASIAPMHPRLETLANDLLEVAKTNADLSTKETAFRSLRAILTVAGAKLSQQFRSDLVGIATRYLDADELDLKTAAAGCVGAVVRFMGDDELAGILKNIIYDTSNTDWNLQHGHCLALGAALKEAGDKLVSETYADSTMDVILKHHTSDRAPVVATSTRCMGLYLLHQRKSNQPLNKKLLIVLAKSFNHPATEVKQRVAEICSHLASSGAEPLDISELKILVPQIVNGTKEKNTAVRYDSEMALADVLRLRKDDSILETCKAAMETGARESLANARKSLSKSVMLSVTKLEELDETLPRF